MMNHCVPTNGINLHYLDYPGGEPLLVLLHGLSANARCFDGLIEAGLSPRFRVLSVDLRGRGLSDKPATGYSIAEHAQDIIGLLDSLGLDRVVMGGHSYGAFITYYVAAHWPERVSRLVLMDAAASMHPRTRELIQPSLDRLGQVVPSWEAYIGAIRQAPYVAGEWNPQLEGFYRADVEVNDDGSVQARSKPAAIAEAADKALAEPWADYLAHIRQPAILFNALGEYGPPGSPPLLPRENAMQTVHALADCRYVEVPGNHLTMLFGAGARTIVDGVTEFVTQSP